VIGEVDAAGVGGEHPGEERRDVGADPGFGQRTRTERGDGGFEIDL
jgi:hypothetical protein